jgi:hypothetical protein
MPDRKFKNEQVCPAGCFGPIHLLGRETQAGGFPEDL